MRLAQLISPCWSVKAVIREGRAAARPHGALLRPHSYSRGFKSHYGAEGERCPTSKHRSALLFNTAISNILFSFAIPAGEVMLGPQQRCFHTTCVALMLLDRGGNGPADTQGCAEPLLCPPSTHCSALSHTLQDALSARCVSTPLCEQGSKARRNSPPKSSRKTLLAPGHAVWTPSRRH